MLCSMQFFYCQFSYTAAANSDTYHIICVIYVRIQIRLKKKLLSLAMNHHTYLMHIKHFSE